MPRLDQRDLEAAERDGLARAGQLDLLFPKPPAAGDVRGRRRAQQDRARLLGDFGGVHRVIEMRMDRDHDCKAIDSVSLESPRDRLHVGRDLAAQELNRTEAREPAVDHPRGLAVREEERRGSREADGQRARPDRSAARDGPGGIDGRRCRGAEQERRHRRDAHHEHRQPHEQAASDPPGLPSRARIRPRHWVAAPRATQVRPSAGSRFPARGRR